jgi:uncharacterized membrane protein
MSEDKVKRLNLMRFWLFGTFVIVWAATFAFTYLWIAPVGADFMDVVVTALPVWVITAVLAVVWYFGYKWWLGRDEGEMAPAAAVPAAAPAAPESVPPAASNEGGSEG